MNRIRRNQTQIVKVEHHLIKLNQARQSQTVKNRIKTGQKETNRVKLSQKESKLSETDSNKVIESHAGPYRFVQPLVELVP